MSIICCMYGPIAIMRDTHHPSSPLASVMKLALGPGPCLPIYNILWTPRRLLRLMISYHLFEVRFLTAWIIYVITASSMFFNVFYVSLYVRKFLHIVLSRTAVNSHVVVCGPTLDRNEHELYVLLFFMYRLV